MAKAKKARTFDELTTLLREARERAKADPRVAQARKLTKLIVEIQEQGVKLPVNPDAELSEEQRELSTLKTERDELVVAIQAECAELVAERSRVAKVERVLAATALADEYTKLDDAELEKMLSAVTSEQRGLKGRKRALRIVLDERARVRAAEEQIAKMSPEERREMLRLLQNSVAEE
jgi:Zn-dependent oligopeptidase